jgi:anion-transporting  ArsA/GET3 family ATPase
VVTVATRRSTTKTTRAAAGKSASLESVFDGSSIVITCGAGGVGKTTAAAALATAAVRHHGGRVLVLTIDPARRLATALGLKAIGNVETQVTVPVGSPDGAELWMAMLDTSASWDDLVRKHAPDVETRDRILANPLYRNITQRFVQSHDYIALERLHDLHVSGRFDLIVIDTPPSRHALDFLDAPQRMAEFFSSSLLRWITLPYRVGGERVGKLGYLAAKPFYQIADRILGSQFLRDIAEFFLLFQSMYAGFVERSEAVTELLHRPETSFLVVTTLEPSPVREAEFLLAELNKRDLKIGGLVINRVVNESFALASSLAEAQQLSGKGPSGKRMSGGRAMLMDASEAEQRVIRAVASNHLRFAAAAEQQRLARRRLESAGPDIQVEVPEQSGDITDLQSLARLGAVMWPVTANART